MWSLLQYQKIGKTVEGEWQRQHLNRSTNAPGNKEEEKCQGSQELNMRLSLNDLERHSPEQCDERTEGREPKNGEIIVDVQGDNDPIDPQNWPLLKRARTMAILSTLVFTQAWAGACDSIGNRRASARFHVSPVAEDLSTAIYLFGIGSGCLFVGPLSQTLGRNPVYLGFTLVYLFFLLGTALARNYATHIVCRYVAGLASSAVLGINGASVGDMFRPVERALWFPVIAWFNVIRESNTSDTVRVVLTPLSSCSCTHRRRVGHQK